MHFHLMTTIPSQTVLKQSNCAWHWAEHYYCPPHRLLVCCALSTSETLYRVIETFRVSGPLYVRELPSWHVNEWEQSRLYYTSGRSHVQSEHCSLKYSLSLSPSPRHSSFLAKYEINFSLLIKIRQSPRVLFLKQTPRSGDKTVWTIKWRKMREMRM